MSQKPVIWTISQVVETILNRTTKNKLDANVGVTGSTGSGKSTLIAKILFRHPKFNPWKCMVFNRTDVIDGLKNNKQGVIWDDEAINSSFKRDYHNKEQHDLIKILTAYRDNLNTFFSAIPDFYSMDKLLLERYMMHIHIIRKGDADAGIPGMAMVFTPQDPALNIFTSDKWDKDNNQKIQEGWKKKIRKNPNYKISYKDFTQISTFRGLLLFNDLTPKQRKIIDEVKATKRPASFDFGNKAEGKKKFEEKLYDMLLEGKLDKEKLEQLCEWEDKKDSNVRITLNRYLRDNKVGKTLAELLDSSKIQKEEEQISEVNKILG